MVRALRGLRRMEHHLRGSAPPARARASKSLKPARGRTVPLTDLAQRSRRRRAPPALAELDRVLGGGLVPGLGHPGRRRSRHRQVDAAAAGARPPSPAPGLKVDLRLGRGGLRAGPHARRSGWASATRTVRLAAETNLRDILDHAGGRAPGPRHHRFDPDHVGRQRRQRARLGQPGPRRRARADELRQGARHRR